MPLVRIKTGFLTEDGQDEILSEYLCDWTDCANVAEYVLGVVRELGAVSIVCQEHAPNSQKSLGQSRAD
ncbi:MAG TPA: hypothetical protein VGN86_17210 [Pyrinomonadaceae bacterium]|jgi:hypothetical protein|nr:hypothetical protein [Pyrinomonadaceae bacterium]